MINFIKWILDGMSLQQSPLNQFQFDIVSAFDVLFHIIDDESYQTAIKNTFMLLRPGGFFVFSENFLHDRSERTEHQVSRSLQEITMMVQQSGFTVKNRVPMFVLMNDPLDQPSRMLRLAWQHMVGLASRSNSLGWILGACLYP